MSKLKEFKINGKIGTPGQKDKLTFLSLVYQIQNGVKRNYSESDICDAVIKSISPELPLRAYLEGKYNLDLRILSKILRSHFKELDATALFTLLGSTCQKHNESAQEFVMRLMSLRQKVLFVSKEDSYQYDHRLVQKPFVHALLTGLKNDNLRSELRAVLKDEVISDEDILEKLSLAVIEENAHLEKFCSLKISLNVNSVTAEEKSTNKPDNEKPKKDNPLLTEIKTLQAQVSQLTALKDDVDFLKQTINHESKPSRKYRPRDKCSFCTDADQKCEHFFLCGSTEHFRAGCKRKSFKSLKKNK